MTTQDRDLCPNPGLNRAILNDDIDRFLKVKRSNNAKSSVESKTLEQHTHSFNVEVNKKEEKSAKPKKLKIKPRS